MSSANCSEASSRLGASPRLNAGATGARGKRDVHIGACSPSPAPAHQPTRNCSLTRFSPSSLVAFGLLVAATCACVRALGRTLLPTTNSRS
eukprot:scaffold14471_cov113-Isochrysis_galbana.AAC.1